MVHIELKEYDEIELEIIQENLWDGRKDTIGDRTLDLIIELNEKFVDVDTGVKKRFLDIVVYPGKNKVKIKAKNWVGFVTVNNLTINILPKFNKEEEKERVIRNLVKMLQVAWEIPIRDVEISSLKLEKDSIFEVLITIYSAKLLDMLKEGMYREYVRISDDLKYVKGQIDFSKYSRRWERRHIIPVNYNDRNPDNILNRTLKYAAHIASFYTANSDNFARLKMIENLMDSVSSSPVALSEVDRIAFTRLNDIYKPLVNMARLLIASASPAFTGGNRHVYAFLIPMEKVFEIFIAKILVQYKERIFKDTNEELKIYVQGADKTKYLLRDVDTNHKVFKLIPDITIKIGDKRYIIDTKYKLLNTEDEKRYGVSPDDVYQMMAYAISYDAEKIMLLYPKNVADFEGEKTWGFESVEKKMANKKLLVRDIDLRIDLINDFDTLLNKLKSHINSLTGE